MDLSTIAISSRIRLARNIKGIPFPNKLHDERAFSEVIKKSYDALCKDGDYSFYQMNALDEATSYSLVEKHLISYDLVKNRGYGAAIISKDEEVSIMLNEEDHIRCQVIKPGFNLSGAYEKANVLDDQILNNFNIAFDDQYGFITACPTNLGTGMRASVMLFLPGLTLTKQINNVINVIEAAGITVRGNFGEGSKTEGYMYQVSNRMTLGVSEEETLSTVENAVRQIAEAEMQARETLISINKNEILNIVYRAKGLLLNSYALTSEEFYENMGEFLLGFALNVYQGDFSKLIRLLSLAGPGSLSTLKGQLLNEEERDLFRAKFVREYIESSLR